MFGKTHHDSDSGGHSPALDDEKRAGVQPGQFETVGHHNLPSDPDANLSAEERARIVSLSVSRFRYVGAMLTCSSLATGPQTALETRSALDSLAMPLVPHLLPRPHQHRQRQARRPAKVPENHRWSI